MTKNNGLHHLGKLKVPLIEGEMMIFLDTGSPLHQNYGLINYTYEVKSR
jgi:hypothetical protein